MPDHTYEQFARQARARGYGEVLARQWQPHQVVEQHTHPFAVHARMVAGEMWLTAGGSTRHLQPGDTFELAHEEPHAERYGSEGATYWVARRSG